MGCGLVVLVSGTGTLLQSLIDAVHTGDLDATILAVGADRSGTGGVDRANRAGLPTFEHPFARGVDRSTWDRELTELVDAYRPDLVISAGFMKLVGPDFLARFGGRMINTHPALLPAFPGMHGVRDALAYGVKVSGATVFLVDAGIDSGMILAQDAVRVLDDDTVETLHERIKVVERQLLLDVVRDWSALSSHREAHQ
ncbi:MAG: phosphoribosylglycinamide formyltransferase [Propionibacteriaceae bacterium]